MSKMLYKSGGNTRVWNTTAHILVVDEADIEQYLADGWLDHPSKLFEPVASNELKTAEELAKLSVSDLTSELSINEYSSDVLTIARDIEVNGKNRSTAIEAYDAAIA